MQTRRFCSVDTHQKSRPITVNDFSWSWPTQMTRSRSRKRKVPVKQETSQNMSTLPNSGTNLTMYERMTEALLYVSCTTRRSSKVEPDCRDHLGLNVRLVGSMVTQWTTRSITFRRLSSSSHLRQCSTESEAPAFPAPQRYI